MAQKYLSKEIAPLAWNTRLDIASQLSTTVEECRKLGLETTARTIQAQIDMLRTQSVQLAPIQLSQILTDLGHAVTSEMSTHIFLHIEFKRKEFYEQHEFFGAAVNTNFTSAREDIKESGCCYATDRNTACVMHLMRVLEVGLGALAKTLNVNFDRRNWENVINDIEAEIAKITGPAWGPDWKQKKEFYAGAAKDFRYFKDAWRNHAMHYRERYDALEAESILAHVKAFMGQLADGGLKE